MSASIAVMILLVTASPACAVSYGDYADAAIKESGTVNTNRSTGLNPLTASSSDVGILNKRQFAQVSQAIGEIARHSSFKAEADRLGSWLSRGYILLDGTLDSATSAETRRDGSSKPFLAPDGGPVGSDKISLDGNIYLNAGKELLFFPPEGLEKMKTMAAALAAKRKSGAELNKNESQILDHLRQRMDGGLSFLFLQSVLVHEAVHTEQRWGGKATKEGAAYDRQLDYLKARLKPALPEDKARLDILIKQTEKDKSEQAK